MRSRIVLLTALLSVAAAHTAVAGVLPADVLSRLDRATHLGAAPASTTMRIGIALRHPDPVGEDAALRALYDPVSPQFHRFLTPASYAQRFGVAPATAAAAQRWLQDAGLHVDFASGAHDYLLASGTAGAIERLFKVDVGRYRFAGQNFLANRQAPTVPAWLPILSVLGLNSFDRHQTMLAQSRTLGRPNATNTGSITPEELWSVYQQPAEHTGQGVSVAILGNGATDKAIADLHTFDRQHGFPELPVQVVRTPANGKFTDESGNVEWNIDMQAIHGMAPGISKEVLYFSPTLADTELVAASAAWANDPNGPPIMNASLGECEVTPLNDLLNNSAFYPINGNANATPLPVSQGISNSSEPMQTQVLKQAVMEGRTFFASSGDAGSSCGALYVTGIGAANGILNFGIPLTEDPANNPYATGVGGTVLYTDGNTPAARTLEYSWTHGGGNASPFLTAPDYQQGVANLNRPCILDQTGAPTNTGKLCRGVPDVAALSGDVLSNGYTIVSDGKPNAGGGTSLSSPLWAGMWARLVSTAPPGSAYGFANEAIYKLAKDDARRAAAFTDITVGTNGLNLALPGWDYTTGFGVPKLAGLIAGVQAVAPAKPYAPVAPGVTTNPPGPTGGCKDTQAPVSHFDAKLTRGRTIAGTSSDRGCGLKHAGTVVRVSVAVARTSGKLCRSLAADGRFGARRSCARTQYLTAQGTTRWKLTLRHTLPRGRYKLFVRGVDSAGNVERKKRSRNYLAKTVR
jgi:pseudomonalisin